MYPLDQPQYKHRKMAKRRTSSYPSHSTIDASQSQQIPNLNNTKDESDTDVSSSSSHTLSVDWAEEGHLPRKSPGLHVEPEVCVEDKTNMTKMLADSLVHTRQTFLSQLDQKEYPLALKMPPLSLFSFPNENGSVKDSLGTNIFFEDTPLHDLQRPVAHSILKNKGRNQKTSILQEQKKAKDIESSEADRPSKVLTHSVDKSKLAETGPQIPSVFQSVGNIGEIDFQYINMRQLCENNSKSCKVIRRQLSRRPGIRLRENQPFPVTPEVSRLRLSAIDDSRSTSSVEKLDASHSGVQPKDFCDTQSLKPIPNQDNFLGAVATPPIADSDFEPFITQGSNIDQFSTYQAVDSWAAQKASLPSPGLSPIHTPNEVEYLVDDAVSSGPNLNYWRNHGALEKSKLNEFSSSLGSHSFLSQIPEQILSDMHSITKTFDSMPSNLQNLMIFQLLRGCPRRTLRVLADIVNPALKCDFLAQLPFELSLQILSFLDHRDLCRSAQVSKQWRNTIDSNETGWRELFDRDGFTLPKGELERAINEGWGWQDPYGPDGFEQDLSVPKNVSSNRNMNSDENRKTSTSVRLSRKERGTTKRKRATGGSERSKRRAINHRSVERPLLTSAQSSYTARFHKSEGPLTAANAAILAVPDPKLGLPSLRRLHLFKSLYRRHYMLQHSWMNGKVTPNHFAFPAHAAHVITCLQFDNDKIITGSDDTLINVYDTKTGEFRKKLEGHEGGVWALQYEGNVLVSGSTDRSVRVWDIEKGLCTQVFHGHTSTVRCLLILMPQITNKTEKGQPIMVPEKPLIITGSRDSQLRVWRLPEQGSKRYIQTGPPANDPDCPYFIRILSGHAHSVRAISAHQDTLVSGSYDNTVRVWKISTGQTIHRLTGHTMKVYSVVLDHKRDRCISGSMDNFVKIWSIDTGACLYTLEGHTSLVGLLDLHDERLVSAAADSTLRIWDPGNGQCKSTLSAHTGAITCFQHDGQKVISGSDRNLKLWNIKTGECLKDLLIDLTGVWQVKFDERRCVAAVQRGSLTYVEVLDFGASRDGVPAYQRGSRRLLSDPPERVVAIDDAQNL